MQIENLQGWDKQGHPGIEWWTAAGTYRQSAHVPPIYGDTVAGMPEIRTTTTLQLHMQRLMKCINKIDIYRQRKRAENK
jgi:hypothetical protein